MTVAVAAEAATEATEQEDDEDNDEYKSERRWSGSSGGRAWCEAVKALDSKRRPVLEVGFARRKPASARGMLRPSFTGRMGDGIRQYTDKLRRRRWFRSSLWKPGRIREILTTEQY